MKIELKETADRHGKTWFRCRDAAGRDYILPAACLCGTSVSLSPQIFAQYSEKPDIGPGPMSKPTRETAQKETSQFQASGMAGPLASARAKDAGEGEWLRVAAGLGGRVTEPGEDGAFDIQWMPKGKQTITPTVNGKPKKVTFEVTAALAEKMDRQLQAMLAEAREQDAALPYTDFNHEDAEASGHGTEFYWDEASGIRLKGRWTSRGQEGIRGRAYTKFSPEWAMNKAGAVMGIGLNLGGLVNRPAFKTIATVKAKSTDGGSGDEVDPNKPATEKKEEPYMKELLKALAKAGLISDSGLSEAEAVAELNAKVENVKAALEVKAKLATDYVSKTEHDDLRKRFDEANAAQAEAEVEIAISDGRIAPKDEAAKAKWTELLKKDFATAKTLLDSIAKTSQVPGQRVQASASERGNTATAAKAGDAGGDAGEHEFVAKAKAMLKDDPKIADESMAYDVLARQQPDLYEAYCDDIAKAS